MTSADERTRTPALARNRRARVLLPIFLVVLTALVWYRVVRTSGPAELELSGGVMGTTWSLRLPHRPQTVPDELEQLVQESLDDIDRKMSTYREDSELSRFNRHTSLDPFPVSHDTLEVFRIAAEVSERTGGALDVTVAPLVALWGFGAGAKIPEAPSEQEIEQALARVGWKRIVIDEAASTLAKTYPDTVCDLSAVAKGYAVDHASEALLAHGVEDFLLEVGGEVRAEGRRPDHQPWRVGVETPDAATRTVLEVVELRGESLATSGDYRNFYEEDGVRRSHILDPRTGRPIEHGLASVSVLHERCAYADAWATALSVLGFEEGQGLAAEEGLAVLLVVRRDGGTLAVATPPFAAHAPSTQ